MASRDTNSIRPGFAYNNIVSTCKNNGIGTNARLDKVAARSTMNDVGTVISVNRESLVRKEKRICS